MTVRPIHELRRFTTSQLVEELARRQNESPRATPEHWCDDCAHFVAWVDEPRAGPMPDNYNPCAKGHRMRFQAPEQIGEEFGFFRRVCSDRDTGEQAPSES